MGRWVWQVGEVRSLHLSSVVVVLRPPRLNLSYIVHVLAVKLSYSWSHLIRCLRAEPTSPPCYISTFVRIPLRGCSVTIALQQA